MFRKKRSEQRHNNAYSGFPRSLTIEMGDGEKITFDPMSSPTGCCNACRQKPEGPYLDMTIQHKGREIEVRLCRHCLSEHVPSMLAELEEYVRQGGDEAA